MSATFDVVGVGLNATDTVLLVPHVPGYGGKAAFRREILSPGGQVATAMVACQKLGLRTKYIGSVGDDQRAEIQVESLRQHGVNIEDLQRRENCSNQSAYIVVDQSTGERTIFWYRDPCLRIDPEQITPENIKCARLLHVDGHDTEAVERAAKIAHEAGIPVTVDVDTIYHGFDRVLPYVDYLVSSTEFPARWTNEDDPYQALKIIQQQFDIPVAAMTLGAQGALALAEGEFLYSPAFVVNCVDTTGAGDVFHGAFCYAVLAGYSLKKTLDFSNAMAALSCKGLGARGGIPSLEEVKELLNSGERRAGEQYQSFPS